MKLDDFKDQLKSTDRSVIYFALNLMNENISKEDLTLDDYEWLAKNIVARIHHGDLYGNLFYVFWTIKPFWKNIEMANIWASFHFSKRNTKANWGNRTWEYFEEYADKFFID